MTTFHEPQPQSRRAARQSERENPESQPSFAHGHNAQGHHGADSSGQRETWDTVARRAAQLPPVAAPVEQEEATDESVGEPLTYTTQARPPVPSYDGPSFRNRVRNRDAASEQPVPEQSASEQAAAEQSEDERTEMPSTSQRSEAEPADGQDGKAAFRVRNFSPESRATPTLSPQWPGASAEAASASSSDLDYQTQAVPPIVAAPVAPVTEVPFPVREPPRPERAMTRRELRALREQQERGGVPEAVDAPAMTDAPVAEPAPGAEPAVAQRVSVDQAAGPVTQPAAEPSAELGRKAAGAAAPRNDSPSSVEAAPEISALDAAEEALLEDTPLSAHAPIVQQPALVEPPRPASSQVGPPPLVEPLVARLSASGITQESPAAAVPTAASAAPAYSPPIGHWSLQATLDDESQPYENTINRTIGSSSSTTNALVLPSIPRASDRGPALTSTGEILLTGSIDVPHSLTAPGAQPQRFDDPGIDKLFDFSDGEGASTDSAPVRAISAVSTHTSTHAVINTKKPQSNRMLTALLISASVMAVGVVGLLIASVAFNLF